MKRFLINVTILFAILVLPVPVWLTLTHRDSYPVEPERNLLFLGDSRVKYGVDDRVLDRAINHSFSRENPYGAYINLRALLSGENNIDTVVLSFWGLTLSSPAENLTDAGRGFDKRMQYVTIDDVIGSNMKPFELLEPIITTLVYSSDDPLGAFEATGRDNLQENVVRREVQIEESDGELTTYDIYKRGVRYRGLCKMRDLCDERGVALILMTLPAYKSDRYLGQEDFKMKLRDSLRGSGFTYVDFSDFPLADSCYGDVLHLNKYGAEIFSDHIRRNGLLSGADEVIDLTVE